MPGAADWVRDEGAALVGLDADAASARAREAGFSPRAVEAGSAVTLEYRPDRVTLHLDRDGRVAEVRAG